MYSLFAILNPVENRHQGLQKLLFSERKHYQLGFSTPLTHLSLCRFSPKNTVTFSLYKRLASETDRCPYERENMKQFCCQIRNRNSYLLEQKRFTHIIKGITEHTELELVFNLVRILQQVRAAQKCRGAFLVFGLFLFGFFFTVQGEKSRVLPYLMCKIAGLNKALLFRKSVCLHQTVIYKVFVGNLTLNPCIIIPCLQFVGNRRAHLVLFFSNHCYSSAIVIIETLNTFQCNIDH